jgi:hypothetical protein
MIGFELSATGDGGFAYADSAWSEGDVWLDKTDLIGNSEYSHGGYHEALVDAMHGTTDKWKELKLDEIASCNRSFKLKVSGGFNFTHIFESNAPAAKTRFDFVQKIRSSRNEMGDNVMLSLCECIAAYENHTDRSYSKPKSEAPPPGYHPKYYPDPPSMGELLVHIQL